jgi:Mlc titration factor MtfA (ptsG expression regulator)
VPFFLLCALAFLFAVWLMSQPWRLARRRARIRMQPFPAAWRRILQERVPYVATLPADLQLQLKQHIQVLLAEKPFLACGGLVLTQEMRVVIAAQACLLILNRPATYFPNLRQILVYPGPFVVNRVRADSTGVLQDLRQILSGESWSQGQVILSWEDVLDGAADPADGRNVVLHEFAHQLDQETGHANGAPQLGSRAARTRWMQIFTAEFALLQQRSQADRAGATVPQDSLLSDYGATSPAEFFAVASEVFFEMPQRMSLEHATLYRELRRFYCVDPLSW